MADQGTGHKLFVGCLPEDTTAEELKMVFSTYGEVNHVHIMNPHSRTGQRCAFVFYNTLEAGEDAIQVLNGIYKIREDSEQPIQVRWGKEKGSGKGSDDFGGSSSDGGDPGSLRNHIEGHKLFVGRLPSDVTEDELHMVFSTYGDVKGVHIMKPNESGLKGAFVFYSRMEAAEDAMKVLDGVYKFREDAPEAIQVRWGRPDHKGGGGKGAGDWGGRGGRDFGGRDFGSRDIGGKDFRGRGLVRDFGGRDFGGRDFGGYRGAGKGWPAMMGYDYGWRHGGGFRDPWLDGRGGGFGGFYGIRDRFGHGSGGYYGGGCAYGDMAGRGLRSGPGRSRPCDTKLYVTNLPDDIEERALEYVFGTYGKVDKIHVMTGKSVNGRISAFIDYTAARDADAAVAALNENYEIRPGYGPLIVKHATPRPKPY